MKVSIVYELEIPDDRLAAEVAKTIQEDKQSMDTTLTVDGKTFFATVSHVNITRMRRVSRYPISVDGRQTEMVGL